MIKNKTGVLICKLRQEKGYSQQELADLIDVTDKAVINWEKGKTKPNDESLRDLSKTFNISIGELQSGEIGVIEKSKVNMLERAKKYLSNSINLFGYNIKIGYIFGFFALVIFCDLIGISFFRIYTFFILGYIFYKLYGVTKK